MVRLRFAPVLVAFAATVLSLAGAPAGAAGPGAAGSGAAGPGAAGSGAAGRGVALAGGDTVRTAGGATCQLAFNLSHRRILTSARCGPTGTRWYAGSVSVGVTSLVVAGKDAAVIVIDNPAVSQLGGVRVGGALAPITAAARAYVGQRVTYYSATLGSRSGTVTAVNQTVNFPGGPITGLDRTTLCATARDGGAPIIAGSTGLSILAGGSVTCGSGAVYAQPITPLLAALGLALY